jgi:hypothetical protein
LSNVPEELWQLADLVLHTASYDDDLQQQQQQQQQHKQYSINICRSSLICTFVRLRQQMHQAHHAWQAR